MALPTIPRKEFVFKNKLYPKGKLTLYPYTVGIEAILLQSKDSEDEIEILNSIRQVIENSIKEKIDVNELPIFLIEDLYVRLRSISSGDKIQLKYRCQNKTIVEEKEQTCNTAVGVVLDLNQFLLKVDENQQDTFMITDTIGIKLKYPSIQSYIDYTEDNNKDQEDENSIYIISIDSIFNGDEVWLAQDQTKEELIEFFSQVTPALKHEMYDKFISKIPHLYTSVKTKCSCCGREEVLEFNKLSDVFI